VRGAGVEPARLSAQEPESCVSANSTTRAGLGAGVVSSSSCDVNEFSPVDTSRAGAPGSGDLLSLSLHVASDACGEPSRPTSLDVSTNVSFYELLVRASDGRDGSPPSPVLGMTHTLRLAATFALLVYALPSAASATSPLDAITPPLPALAHTQDGTTEPAHRTLRHDAPFGTCESAYRELIGTPDGLGQGWTVAGVATTENGSTVEVALAHVGGLLYRLSIYPDGEGCRIEIHGEGHGVAFDPLTWALPPLGPLDHR
jgi:hypothetical protein